MQLQKVAVFQELHANGQPHFHFPMVADGPWCFAPLARALRGHQIHVDFAASHDYYWSCIVYCAVPDAMPDGKGIDDLDTEPWLSPGHPPVLELLQDIPRGARNAEKQRVRRFLALEPQPDDKSKDVSLTDKQFCAHLVKLELRDETALLAYMTTQAQNLDQLGVDERLLTVGLEAYCLKHQGDLQKRISFA